jgi:hypothetical protein
MALRFIRPLQNAFGEGVNLFTVNCIRGRRTLLFLSLQNTGD